MEAGERLPYLAVPRRPSSSSTLTGHPSLPLNPAVISSWFGAESRSSLCHGHSFLLFIIRFLSLCGQTLICPAGVFSVVLQGKCITWLEFYDSVSSAEMFHLPLVCFVCFLNLPHLFSRKPSWLSSAPTLVSQSLTAHSTTTSLGCDWWWFSH